MRVPDSSFWAHQRVLGVFAHPDDESFSAGGTLRAAHEGGAPVFIASATLGEAGWVRGQPDFAGDLGRLRHAELSEACQILGASPPLVGPFSDGQLADIEPTLLDDWVGRVLERTRPTIVISLGMDGAYGHRDHIALAAAVRRIQQTGGDSFRLWEVAFPSGLFWPIYRRLRRHIPVLVAQGWERSNFGAFSRDLSWRIPLGFTATKKVEAVGAHRSQLDAGRPHSFLVEGLLGDLLTEETFIERGEAVLASWAPEKSR